MVIIHNFTFNREKKDYIRILSHGKPYSAPRNVSILKVDGMKGGHVDYIDVDPIIIPLTIRVEANSQEQLNERAEEIADWLTTDEPKELVFDVMPNRTYYALLNSQITPEDMVRFSTVELEFICPDGVKHGDEKPDSFSSDGFLWLDYKGTEPTRPIFRMEVKEASTFAMVQNQDNRYMMIGRPYDVESHTFQRYERVFYTDANTTNGWAKASNGDIDGGIVDGNIVPRNNRFIAESYGSGNNWHGPAIKTSISEPLQDFRLSAFVGFLNLQQAAMVGRVEIYLLDVNNNAVAKMALKDTSAARANVFAEMRAGDRDTGQMIINDHGSRVGAWNNFSGQLQIAREGNVWSAYVALVDTATRRHHARRIVRAWPDTHEISTRPVTQIVVHLGTVGKHTPIHANSGVSSIILEKINQEQGIPYIVYPGDVIEFDHVNEDIYLNGISRKDLKDFGATYFDIEKGENRLVTYPDIFHTSVYYRERFK